MNTHHPLFDTMMSTASTNQSLSSSSFDSAGICCDNDNMATIGTDDSTNYSHKISSQRFVMTSVDAQTDTYDNVINTSVAVATSTSVDYSNCKMLSSMQRQFQQQQLQLQQLLLIQRKSVSSNCSIESSMSYSCPNTPQSGQHVSTDDDDSTVSVDWNNATSVLPYHHQQQYRHQKKYPSQKLSSLSSSSSSTSSLARKRIRHIQKHKGGSSTKRRRNIICWNRLPTMYEEVQEDITNNSSSSSLSVSSQHFDNAVVESRMDGSTPRILQSKVVTSPTSLAMPMLLSSMATFNTGVLPTSPSYINRRFRQSSIQKDISPRQPTRKSSLTLSSSSFDAIDVEMALLIRQSNQNQNQQQQQQQYHHHVTTGALDKPAKQPERKLSISLLTEPFEHTLRFVDPKPSTPKTTTKTTKTTTTHKAAISD